LSKKAIVIGSGIGGIAAALRLRKKGLQVIVLEKNSYPGGKLNEFRKNGFRFDMGPSLFTLPHLVDELFELYDKIPEDYFKYVPLKTITRYFFSDGTSMKAPVDTDDFIQELEAKLNTPKSESIRFFKKSKELYDMTHHVFLERSLHKANTYLRKDTLKAALKLYKLEFYKSMHRANADNFSDDRAVQLFDRFATYNGSNPYKAPATLNIIPHLEHSIGAFFPEKGMYSIIEALYALALDHGIQFNFNEEVKEIGIKNNKATAVKSSKNIYSADYVISNSDVIFTYENLIKKGSCPAYIKKQERSSSALIFYWGIKREFPELDLHNILFSSDYKTEFKKLFEEKNLSDDPTVYIYISSKMNPEDSPEGMENWFVMINAPCIEEQNWSQLIDEARTSIQAKINRHLNCKIENEILFEEILSPEDIEKKTGSFKGSLYGSSSNNMLAAFLRHPNFSRKYKNLFFSGGSVHPGGGIPLCLLSAKILSQMIN